MTFTVVGADARFHYTAEALQKLGHHATYVPKASLTEIRDSERLILPVPVSRDGITLNTAFKDAPITMDVLANSLQADCRVFCGNASESVARLFHERGIRLFDYGKREEFAVRNALPTAEGVIEILLRTLPITLRGANIWITGFGRTARACARVLYAMGAHITVAARRCSALATADGFGYRALYLNEMAGHIHSADAVINTVPSLVLDRTVLSEMQKMCPIIDIASAPYGTDFEAAKTLGIPAQTAPSLPGKTAPKTAGIILADTVLNILREESE